MLSSLCCHCLLLTCNCSISIIIASFRICLTLECVVWMAWFASLYRLLILIFWKITINIIELNIVYSNWRQKQNHHLARFAAIIYQYYEMTISEFGRNHDTSISKIERRWHVAWFGGMVSTLCLVPCATNHSMSDTDVVVSEAIQAAALSAISNIYRGSYCG